MVTGTAVANGQRKISKDSYFMSNWNLDPKKQQLCPNLTECKARHLSKNEWNCGTVSVAPRKSPVFRGSPNFPPHAWPTPAHAAGATGTTGGLGAKFAPRAAEAPLDESHPWISKKSTILWWIRGPNQLTNPNYVITHVYNSNHVSHSHATRLKVLQWFVFRD